ncbi:MAG: DNA adenine methylase [Nanoarchaeota archaeon]
MTLNYIGSKLSLLEFIHFVVNKEIKEDIYVVGDLFSGTGIVGQSFKKKGYKIIANDIQYYSYVMNKKFLNVNNFLEFRNLSSEINNLDEYEKKEKILFVLNYLNNLTEKKAGFIFNNYSLTGTKGKEFERMYFSDENALQIDTIRIKIETWFKDKKITEQEYFYLLGTLLEASDKVANTASVYGAFLKKIKTSAQKKLKLEFNEIIFGEQNNVVFNDDILNILNNEEIDLLYLDPPYNHRQYATNYHILETISKYDDPKISGKTGLREYQHQKSDFCSRNKVKIEFKKIIQNTNAKYILLSYNNEGLMSIKDVQEIMSLRGKPKTFILRYKRFKADKTENRNHKADSTYEYLHFVKCDWNREYADESECQIIEIDKEMLNNQTKLSD